MGGLLGLGLALLLVGLALFCTLIALTIRRDYKTRVGRLREQLEEDANALVGELFNERRT
jgi:hypothetical protein